MTPLTILALTHLCLFILGGVTVYFYMRWSKPNGTKIPPGRYVLDVYDGGLMEIEFPDGRYGSLTTTEFVEMLVKEWVGPPEPVEGEG